MPRMRTVIALLAGGVFLCALAAHGQDAPPSLGDAARQARAQKQQQKDAEATKDTPPKDAPSKDTPSKDTPPKDPQQKNVQPPKVLKKVVITNDEIPEHIGPTQTAPNPQNQGAYYPQQYYGNATGPADYWKSQIQSLKNYISSMESQIKTVSDSIQYAGGNCVSNCVQWNERQQQKQQQVEVMKQQLEQQQKRLEDMQEAARKQGFGSSVYDP